MQIEVQRRLNEQLEVSLYHMHINFGSYQILCNDCRAVGSYLIKKLCSYTAEDPNTLILFSENPMALRFLFLVL
jgi:hypothetical protein